MGVMDETVRKYRDALQERHREFIDEPIEERAWSMAAAVECLLEVLDRESDS